MANYLGNVTIIVATILPLSSARNPFAELKGGSVLANKSRDYFVTRKEAQAVLDACPDNEWRLIFTLARHGGTVSGTVRDGQWRICDVCFPRALQ